MGKNYINGKTFLEKRYLCWDYGGGGGKLGPMKKEGGKLGGKLGPMKMRGGKS